MKIEISEIQINIIKPQNGLIAFASFVINNQLYLSSVGIHKKLGKDEHRLTYPTRIVGKSSRNIFHPINKETGLAIEKAVINKLKDVMNKYDRHNCAYA